MGSRLSGDLGDLEYEVAGPRSVVIMAGSRREDPLAARCRTQPDLPKSGPQGSIFVLGDRKSTRLNSSHPSISYAVFCLKKKKICLLSVFSSVREDLAVS